MKSDQELYYQTILSICIFQRNTVLTSLYRISTYLLTAHLCVPLLSIHPPTYQYVHTKLLVQSPVHQSTFYYFFFFSTILVKFWMSSAISRGSSMAAKWPPRAIVVKVRSLRYFCLTHSLGVCMSSLGKQAKPVGTYTGIL